jgi:hypothetical protein
MTVNFCPREIICLGISETTGGALVITLFSGTFCFSASALITLFLTVDVSLFIDSKLI